MSARRRIVGPGNVPSMTATTPVCAMPVRTSSPSARRCSATFADVRTSRLASSGWRWKSRRHSTTRALEGRRGRVEFGARNLRDRGRRTERANECQAPG